jgi:hypothetical protein
MGNIVLPETATYLFVNPLDPSIAIEDVDAQREGIENRLKSIEV